MPKIDTFTADDIICGSNPSGGRVIGRCWEACSSWVPVSSLVFPHGSLDRLKSVYGLFLSTLNSKDRQSKTRHSRAGNSR